MMSSEWQLEQTADGVRQRRSETPVGLYGIGRAYYNRYGLPMMLTAAGTVDGNGSMTMV